MPFGISRLRRGLPRIFRFLPGLILELDINNGDVVIEAEKVDFRPIAAEMKLPKVEGKRIKESGYTTLISNYTVQSIKAHRNPFWVVRY